MRYSPPGLIQQPRLRRRWQTPMGSPGHARQDEHVDPRLLSGIDAGDREFIRSGSNALPYCRFIRPRRSSQTLVDPADAECVLPIERGRRSSLEDRNAERLEISWVTMRKFAVGRAASSAPSEFLVFHHDVMTSAVLALDCRLPPLVVYGPGRDEVRGRAGSGR